MNEWDRGALDLLRALARIVLAEDARRAALTAGQGGTPYFCKLCRTKQEHSSSCVPLVCETCADDLLQIVSPLDMPSPTLAEADHVLGPTNYRDFAQRAVASYYDKGMIVDALLWRQIVGHYEAALKALPHE